MPHQYLDQLPITLRVRQFPTAGNLPTGLDSPITNPQDMISI
ncbi:hypothetical protein [Nostoc sp. MS1]|nr:hypothetical protein [Nostoc sp. MS1]